MLDFVKIIVKKNRGGSYTVCPEFIVELGKDLMTRGHSFYAVWDEEANIWSTSEIDIVRIIDKEIETVVNQYKSQFPDVEVSPLYLKNFSNKMWNSWIDYVKKSPDHYHDVDSKIIFLNDEVKREDYATRKLPYPLKEGEFKAYEELMSTLYDPDERNKLEWAIGSVIAGDSKEIQKFVVLYGEQGSGKSTVLNIIEALFPGYVAGFKAKSLGQANNSFALEPFKLNPLIAIDHEADLSKIEDNTTINSLVSHESLVMNEKHKSQYTMKFKTFLFMGSNKPVKSHVKPSHILIRKSKGLRSFVQILSNISSMIASPRPCCTRECKIKSVIADHSYGGYCYSNRPTSVMRICENEIRDVFIPQNITLREFCKKPNFLSTKERPCRLIRNVTANDLVSEVKRFRVLDNLVSVIAHNSKNLVIGLPDVCHKSWNSLTRNRVNKFPLYDSPIKTRESNRFLTIWSVFYHNTLLMPRNLSYAKHSFNFSTHLKNPPIL